MHRPPIPHVATTDPEIAELIDDEARRQHDTLGLIPSENYVSRAVLEATGTVLTNKYSEGYPGKRYYEGQQVIDQIEGLAVDRAQRSSASTTSTCSPTRARRPTWPCTSPSWSRATRSWAWTCPWAGTSPTAGTSS